jgi:hypothetical protein
MCGRQEQKASSGAKNFRINPTFTYPKTKKYTKFKNRKVTVCGLVLYYAITKSNVFLLSPCPFTLSIYLIGIWIFKRMLNF